MDWEKLLYWQDKLERCQMAYEEQLEKMEKREEIYLGSSLLTPGVQRDLKRETPHVRNLAAELIEAQVNAQLPQPKVRAIRKEDEGKARLIEDMLKNEMDRLPFAEINDQMERTVPIQGGCFLLLEWDQQQSARGEEGELSLSLIHPKQLIPQEGVWQIEDMDYFFLKLPQTRESLSRRYGVTFSPGRQQTEEDLTEEMAMQIRVYYKNDKGGIGVYSWAEDVELEDMEDYQGRQVTRCDACGREKQEGMGETCPCGGNWEKKTMEEETLVYPRFRRDGSRIPGLHVEVTEEGQRLVTPTKLPLYRPGVYPILLQKNVSVYGRLLGDSDIDKIADQQNTVNRVECKIIEKLIKSGSYLVLPDDASIRADGEEMKVIRPGTPAAAQMIAVKDMEGNISQDMAYLSQVYEEARQSVGVTDAFQGRRDTTATSGKAKEIAAAQAAGRLESKRVLKDAAYSALFEAMFRFKLAYADEKRPVMGRNAQGEVTYETFDRFDFLEQGPEGAWYWNDRFLFSCDHSALPAGNRETMWQETRQNLQSGAFGDPGNPQTLLLFWTRMEQLHYPGASETKRFIQEQMEGAAAS